MHFKTPFSDILKLLDAKCNLAAWSCENSALKKVDILADIQNPGHNRCRLQASEMDYQWTISQLNEFNQAFDLKLKINVLTGYSKNISFGLSFNFNKWSTNNYVLMPGAVYAGNRFLSKPISYPPCIIEPELLGAHTPIVVGDIPRLCYGQGKSKIEQLANDLATPAIGFYDPDRSRGFFMLSEPPSGFASSGFTIEENQDRSQATISLLCPMVRDTVFYKAYHFIPSKDYGMDCGEGDIFEIKLRFFSFECSEIIDFYKKILQIRGIFRETKQDINELPFSEAWNILENKYNRDNWNENGGYYSVEVNQNKKDAWIPGWTGGMISNYPLLFNGTLGTKTQALKHLNYALTEALAPSGFFLAVSDGREWMGENLFPKGTHNRHLVRASADSLYYVLKQFMLLRLQGQESVINSSWNQSLKSIADAFVKLWDWYKQFGQFVDTQNAEIILGGSASASLAIGALALASKYFNHSKYLDIAIASGYDYYNRFGKNGIFCGGPGEALYAPDSESCYAMVESMIALYEVTGDCDWIVKASDVANQFATWVISYDFPFPPDSTFGKLNIKSKGAVFANAQNKHGAPGICTHSGIGLLKLYRLTGNIHYIELLQDIARGLPQYLSRQDRPIAGMPSGWMNERVETNDWREDPGEIYFGSGWAEISLMLTCFELPSIYIQTDKKNIFDFDNLDSEIINCCKEKMTICIINKTKYDAVAKIFYEKSEESRCALALDYLKHSLRVEIPAASSYSFNLNLNS